MVVVSQLPGIVARNSVMGQNDVGYYNSAKTAKYNDVGTLMVLRWKPQAITLDDLMLITILILGVYY